MLKCNVYELGINKNPNKITKDNIYELGINKNPNKVTKFKLKCGLRRTRTKYLKPV